MSDLVIAIVPRSGSRDHLWHGVLQKSDEHGYSGKLLSYEISKDDFKNLFNFDVPSSLDKSVLHCMLDGSEFGTILWPRFGGRSFSSSSRSIEIRIPTLLRDVHIDEAEKEVESISLRSPFLLPLFGASAFTQEFEIRPHKLSIQTDYRSLVSFDSSLGQVELRSLGQHNSSHAGLELKCYGVLTVRFTEKQTPLDAVRLVRKIEHLFSLLCFSYVAFENADLRIENTNQSDDSEKEKYFISRLERSRPHKKTKTDLNRHDLPLTLNHETAFGAVLDRFLEIHAKIERSLNWYRVIKVETRYIEDRFFNSVRMIEGLYNALNLDVDVDARSLKMIECIRARLGRDSDLLHFLDQRIRPIFSKPISTASVIKNLQTKYSDVKFTEMLNVRRINSLRAKEAHGTADRYSGSDYQYMIFVTDLLQVLYVCLVLEVCGFDKNRLLQELRESVGFRKLFDEKHLDRMMAALGDASAID